jgi:hypothetical protein
MGKVVFQGGRTHLSLLLRRLLGPRKHARIRLSPLKVLLYLEAHQREVRVSTPSKLGEETGIKGYDVIKNSYAWLFEHGYIAVAPGIPLVGGVAEILDPRELVVTAFGKEALKPYLATFSLEEVVGVALSTLALGFFLGLTEVLFQLYPTYLWIVILLDLVAGILLSAVAALALREANGRKKERVAELIESVTDRG